MLKILTFVCNTWFEVTDTCQVSASAKFRKAQCNKGTKINTFTFIIPSKSLIKLMFLWQCYSFIQINIKLKRFSPVIIRTKTSKEVNCLSPHSTACLKQLHSKALC